MLGSANKAHTWNKNKQLPGGADGADGADGANVKTRLVQSEIITK